MAKKLLYLVLAGLLICSPVYGQSAITNQIYGTPSWQDHNDSTTIDADTVDGLQASAFSQPGDNVSDFINDAGYVTNATVNIASTDLSDSTTINAATLDGLDSTDFADSTVVNFSASTITDLALVTADSADTGILVDATDGALKQFSIGDIGGGSLDSAYDYPTAGAGRSITVDSGAVALTSTDANDTMLYVTNDSMTNGILAHFRTNAPNTTTQHDLVRITQDNTSNSKSRGLVIEQRGTNKGQVINHYGNQTALEINSTGATTAGNDIVVTSSRTTAPIVNFTGNSLTTGTALVLNTTSVGSHMRFDGAATNTTLTEGELWYDGTSALNFRDSTTTYNLLAGQVTAGSANYDSGWFTANSTTVYTKAHGISGITNASTAVMVHILHRVNSSDDRIQQCPIGAYDGASGVAVANRINNTNIYVYNFDNWTESVNDALSTGEHMPNGELRIFIWKME